MPYFPLELLEDMASKEAQVRLIINGDVNEYLLPEELLHNAARFCELAAKIDAPSTPHQRSAIASLCETMRNLPDIVANYDRANIATLIEIDPHWRLIRERAAGVLRAFEHCPTINIHNGRGQRQP